MMKSKRGFDCYQIKMSPIKVLKICKNENICVYHVKKDGEKTFFSLRVKERKQGKKAFPQAIYLYTNGIVGMFLRNMKSKSRLISYACVIFIWSILSMSIFHIDVYGESDTLDQSISTFLKKDLYTFKDSAKMKSALLSKYKDQISWLEVYDKGSVVKVRYALKEKVNKKEVKNAPLVANKDGMIAYFECNEGNKVKKVNDIVKKGEILVDNKMLDSYNKELDINVDGKVYAYTWQKVSVEIKGNKLPKAMNYFSLLLKARDQISIDIEDDEEIVKENILQFSQNEGKIKIDILYTLLENITS